MQTRDTAALEWQPIETAPKDGSVVWLKNGQMDEPVMGRWGDYHSPLGGGPLHRWVSEFTPRDYFPVQAGLLVCPTAWAPVSAEEPAR